MAREYLPEIYLRNIIRFWILICHDSIRVNYLASFVCTLHQCCCCCCSVRIYLYFVVGVALLFLLCSFPTNTGKLVHTTLARQTYIFIRSSFFLSFCLPFFIRVDSSFIRSFARVRSFVWQCRFLPISLSAEDHVDTDIWRVEARERERTRRRCQIGIRCRSCAQISKTNGIEKGP